MSRDLYTVMPRDKYNELYHYGVKGMRWGVRKKYTPSLKKQVVEVDVEGNRPNRAKAKQQELVRKKASAIRNEKARKKQQELARKKARSVRIRKNAAKAARVILNILFNPISLITLPGTILSAGNKFIKKVLKGGSE